MAEFGFSFRNLSELIIEGRKTPKGRIEYFKAFGSVSIVVFKVKLKIGERLNAIAQVIAESHGESLCLCSMGYVILWNP